ncbi:MAG: PAS domain-containing sensor histidine kinase [Candidatus Omnitrophota bacterium]|jgi:PAS domain S-box-containing protein|nr:MAG: PAS domain-containing sensor histidine kinase [Candidatus Omnitrophota bacterium]
MNDSILPNWLHSEAFERVTQNIAIIDRDFRIVEANRNFAKTFGEWQGQYCYKIYKRRDTPCESCLAMKTFEDGKSRVKDETGYDQNGDFAYYVVRTEPIPAADGSIPYVIEFSDDITESQEIQRVYHVLFDRVPCYVQILDRNLRVVRANKKQRETFGECEGRHCHDVYKRKSTRCHPCPALLAFQDGQVHTAEHVGVATDGREILFVTTASPLSRGDNQITHVIEISMDVTAVRTLQSELQKANALEESLINNSTDGIVAFDEDGKIMIINPAAELILKCPVGEAVGGGILKDMFPQEFQEILDGRSADCHLEESCVIAKDQERIPVRFNGVALRNAGNSLGCAAFFQDLRPMKKLEEEKLEAERLAAVGETVAGLAHSVKNVLQALEGGMYALRSGLSQKNEERVLKGWGVIERNFDKVTSLVKDFLSFSKGRLPETQMVNPNELVMEVIALYKDVAHNAKVRLIADLEENLQSAPLDPSGIHTCLTNLLSNAIDATVLSEKGRGNVTIRTREKNGCLIFEVSDEGCGMDYDVKRKVFTSFFTTKGGGGTGLGLLTTRKIVQEHGGQIVLDSEIGQGTTFRIELPRHRLPSPTQKPSDS